ncbi:hypothetical protein GH714_020877 [Hevea brasiliensis]|uniref:Uncharacterized protein n=1 Tax=Hevea brasiliensis TaxID=3981 RepID=A0A6A6LMB4_HEVBR|nr:hypothetical protein GH714_020877 [Hevea brasiliensis]
MGLFSLTMAGGCFIMIGAWESFTSSTSNPSLSSVSSSVLDRMTKSTTQNNPNPKDHSFSLVYIVITVFSFLFVIDSLISLFYAINSQDGIGSALQLQVLAVAAHFCLYSILGLASNFSSSVRFPSSLLDLILLFAFVEEFLLYYLQRKDTTGIENRGDYTIKCKGHSDYHRARGIATLQFNCHLALLVVLLTTVHSVMAKKNRNHSNFKQYKPLGAEMENNEHFTLDSDEDEIREEENAVKDKLAVVEMVAN